MPCFHLKLVKDIFNTSSIKTTFKEFISIEILLMNWISNKWINNDDNINKKKRTRFSFSIEFIRDGLYIFEVKMRQFHINSVWKWEFLITFLFLVAMVSLYLENTSFYAVTGDGVFLVWWYLPIPQFSCHPILKKVFHAKHFNNFLYIYLIVIYFILIFFFSLYFFFDLLSYTSQYTLIFFYISKLIWFCFLFSSLFLFIYVIDLSFGCFIPLNLCSILS